MRREQLEHVLRAAAGVTDQLAFVVIGSQAILGTVANPPAELVTSVEADLFPRDRPDLSDNIDGAIGDGSIFHDTFGYYAHGVGPETPIAPAGWRDRLVPLENANTGGATGLCMEVHDLVLSKLAAGRDKDVEFARVAISAGIVDRDELLARLDALPVDDERRASIRAFLAA